MSAPDWEADLQLATDAAHRAGEEVMRHFRRPEEVRFKAPDQPVTAADLASDRLLREVLTAARPDYGWLSEETVDAPERLTRRRVWIVDPIDGTNSFVEGRPEFVISIGLAEDGMAVLGVVLNPATGELFRAARGLGAYRGDQRIEVAPPARPNGGGVLVVSRSELAAGELEPFDPLWRTLPLGSTAYKMVRVADGSVDLYASRRSKSEWDVCGAQVVVEEAGGTVHDAAGRQLRFNRRLPSFPGVIASAGHDPELIVERFGRASGRSHSAGED